MSLNFSHDSWIGSGETTESEYESEEESPLTNEDFSIPMSSHTSQMDSIKGSDKPSAASFSHTYSSGTEDKDSAYEYRGQNGLSEASSNSEDLLKQYQQWDEGEQSEISEMVEEKAASSETTSFVSAQSEEMEFLCGADLRARKRQHVVAHLEDMIAHDNAGHTAHESESDIVLESSQTIFCTRNRKKIPYSEFLKTTGADSMLLAHDIAIDNNFLIKPLALDETKPEDNVQMLLTNAYWNALNSSLSKNEPDYKRALIVLEEVRKMLLSFLFPYNKCMKNAINSVLDQERLSKAVKNDTFNIQEYMEFVTDVMGQLCCPARDRDVINLKEISNPSEMFQEAFRVMDKMQCDFGNFLVHQYRPFIINNVISYERLKFAEFLEQNYLNKEDGLKATREWLTRHKEKMPKYDAAIGEAYSELLNWKEGDTPETLTLDWKRFENLSHEITRLTYVGAILVEVFVTVKSLFGEDSKYFSENDKPNLPMTLESQRVREELRCGLSSLITVDDVRTGEIDEALKKVAVRAIKIANSYAKKTSVQSLTNEHKMELKKQIFRIGGSEHAVRDLFFTRIQAYTADMSSFGGRHYTPLPQNLLIIRSEVYPAIVDFNRLILHNRALFDSVYLEILKGKVPPFKYSESGQRDPNLSRVLLDLKGPLPKKLDFKTRGNERLSPCQKLANANKRDELSKEAALNQQSLGLKNKGNLPKDVISPFLKTSNTLQNIDSKSNANQAQSQVDDEDIRGLEQKVALLRHMHQRADAGLPVFNKYIKNMEKFCQQVNRKKPLSN